MRESFTKFSALFVAVFILLIGHGLQLALLPVRASQLGWAATDIGITGSIYFAGFLAGCFLTPVFLSRVGHIRVFSATTTICGIALLGIAFSEAVWWWSVLRFVTGLGISGCYVIIESWLNDQATNDNRGRLLGAYTVTVLLGMTLGQYSVGFTTATDVAAVIVGAVFLLGAVIPVTLTRMHQPAISTHNRFELRSVMRAAPTAIGCAFFFGVVTSTLYTLVPVVTLSLNLDIEQTAAVLVAMLIGSAVLQFPIGMVSDRVDRRIVIAVMTFAGLGVGVTMVLLEPGFTTAIVGFFLLGGAASVVYPLCLAHANDRMPGEFVKVGTCILFINSIGAISGPFVISTVIQRFGPVGFYSAVAMLFGLTALWACLGLARRAAPESETGFIGVAKSSPAIFELDPRVEDAPIRDVTFDGDKSLNEKTLGDKTLDGKTLDTQTPPEASAEPK